MPRPDRGREAAGVTRAREPSKRQGKQKSAGETGASFFVAPTGGFEPLACRLGGGRSILLSYVGMFSLLYEYFPRLSTAEEGDYRTKTLQKPRKKHILWKFKRYDREVFFR